MTRGVGRIRSALLTAGTVAAAVVYVVVPTAAQVTTAGEIGGSGPDRPPALSPQEPAPEVTVPAAALAALRKVPAAERADPPVILAYHDVSAAPDHYTVTPESFAVQMGLLAEAGYRTVTPAEVVDWMAGGRRLPPRAVLLTFDDGVEGLWRHADPVLARHRYTASTFLITGPMKDVPVYHLSWAEARALGASGRWSLEAHSHDGHRRVPLDAAGREGPALTNRAWLPGPARPETVGEYTTRVTADVTAQLAAFAQHGLPRPQLFAYPFSAVDGPTNDRRLPAILRGVVSRAYAAAMVNEYGAATTTPAGAAARELRRIEVTADTSPAAFVAAVARGTALPRDTRLLADRALWTDGDRPGPAPVRGRTTLRAPAGRYADTALAPGRTGWWTDYRLSGQVGGLRAGAAGAVLALAGSPAQVRVSASRDRVTVRRGLGRAEKVVAERPLAAARTHLLRVTVTADGKVRVEADGTVVFDGAYPPRRGAWVSGGIGLAVAAGEAAPAAVTVEGLRVDRLT